MSVGDYTNPTWTNDVTKLNSTNMQAITDKLYELDQYLAKQIRYVKKASDETVNNTTTFQDDNDLNITFPAKAAIYEIQLVGFISGVDAGNFKTKWVVGGGATAVTSRNCIGPTATAGDLAYVTKAQMGVVDLATTMSYGTDGTYQACIRERFIVSTTSSASTLKLQWAQDTATVGNTTLESDTYMTIKEIIAWS